MKFLTKNSDESLFKKYWLSYQDNNITGLDYSIDMIEYYMTAKKLNLFSDESFVLLGGPQDNICLAICSLPIYKIDSILCSEGVAPLAFEKSNLLMCFDYIDTIAKQHELSKIEFFIDFCYAVHGEWKYNYLRDYGFIDCTTNNYVFHINNNADNMFQKFNNSSRNILRKTLRNNSCKTIIYDDTNINLEVFNKYKELHIICAGRQTRDDDTFLVMFKLIEKRSAILLEFNYEQKAVGYLVVFLSHPYAYMWSTSNLPEYEHKLPIYRMLVWKTIEYCLEYKLINFGFPAGESLVDGFNSYMNEKQIEISKYKSFMGAIRVPNFRGVKYYDEDLFNHDFVDFGNNVRKLINVN